jgi:hypothetical protein
LISLIELDLELDLGATAFRIGREVKPVSTFPDRALSARLLLVAPHIGSVSRDGGRLLSNCA